MDAKVEEEDDVRLHMSCRSLSPYLPGLILRTARSMRVSFSGMGIDNTHGVTNLAADQYETGYLGVVGIDSGPLAQLTLSAPSTDRDSKDIAI